MYSGDPFEHVGSILVNISKAEQGRKLLLDPKRGLLKQIIRQFDSTSLIRKKGVCIFSFPSLFFNMFSCCVLFFSFFMDDQILVGLVEYGMLDSFMCCLGI